METTENGVLLETPYPTRKEKLSRRKVITRGFFAFTSFAVSVGVDAFVIEPNRLTVDAPDIHIPSLPQAFDGYRIALIADIHYPRHMHPEYVQSAVALASSYHPDVMVFAGDICDHKGSATVPNLSGLFDKASAKDGVWGTLGNHDHWLDAPGIRKELNKHTPIRMIENEAIMVERGGHGLAIGGVGDLWCGVVDVPKAFAKVPPDMARILISHNPDLAEDLRDAVRVDLQLSGHMHGGQIYIPGYGGLLHPSKYGKKFCQGLVQGKAHRVYVTRGLHSAGRIRLNCPPAVSIITLRCTP